ncbi:MAG: LysM peptidoglycan-binding domain-containing protein [Myxococcota bacterium]|jgi:LysM repeat protein|nr:LysM peptidoglycan-binding domain-containing protein [Myxococcota bacterium]
MPAEQTYTVKPGDTLSKIADALDVPGGYQAIARLNNLSNPNKISVGQNLRIPGGSSNAPSNAGSSGGGGNQTLTYTVRSGDTLAKIAERFNYPGGYQALARANGISNPNNISVGQKLKVGNGASGGGGQTAPAPNTGAPAPAPAPAPQDNGRKDAPVPGESAWIGKAVSYNSARPYSKAQWREFQEKIGTTPDGSPGKMTARAVYRWQESHNLTKDGQLGPATARTLGYQGGTSPGNGGNAEEPSGPGNGSVTGLRQRILDIAHSTLSTRTGHHYYSQPGALTQDPLAKPPLRSDCSQWVRAVYLQAGAGDPGTYTGAMVTKSKKTSNPIPGDIMLKSGHVELYIGNGETIGHGSPPIDKSTTAYWKGRGMYYATYDFLNR